MKQLQAHTVFRGGKWLAWSLLALSVVLLIIGLVVGSDWTLPWYISPTYVNAPLFIETFQAEGQSFGITLDQVLVWQHYQTGEMRYLGWPETILLVALLLTLLFIGVLITYLNRFWYLLSAGLGILLIIQLNLTELGFIPDFITIIAVVLFAATTYYFQNIRPDRPLGIRFVVLLLVFGLLTLALASFGKVVSPGYVTVSFGLFAPVLLSVLFLLFIGGDNVFALFRIATQNAPSGKNGLYHFLSISVVYLTMVILLFLDKIGEISMDLFLVNPSTLLLASTLSGYFALQHKLRSTEVEFPFPMLLQWAYPLMAGITLIMLFFGEITANNSLTDTLELGILLSHIAGGLVFIIYAFMNFTPRLMSGEKEEILFFKGDRAPLLTARILYVILIVGGVFYLDSRPYYQAQAARFNTLGALARHTVGDVLAKQYYQQGVFFDYFNFKANYPLARIERRENNPGEVIEKYSSPLQGKYDEKARVALANFYSDANQLFSKQLTLVSAPEATTRLRNNLAIAEYELQRPDSALMLLATDLSDDTPVTMANWLALQYYQEDRLEELPAITSTDRRVGINQQAMANRYGLQATGQIKLASDTFLLQDELFYLYNAGLNPNTEQSEALITTFDYYLANPRNNGLRDYLLLARALQAYKLGHVNDAFSNIQELRGLYPANENQYLSLLALWSAHHNAWVQAEEYLRQITQWSQKEALQQAIQRRQIPMAEPKAMDIDQLISSLPPKDQAEWIKANAGGNAFNVDQVLELLNALEGIGLGKATQYEYIRDALTINPYDVRLNLAFIEIAIEAGLGSFAATALENLRGKIPEEALGGLISAYETFTESWNERELDGNQP